MREQFRGLVIADVFRNLAISMIALFIPIYLLNIGFAFAEIVLMELGMYVSSIILHYLILQKIHFFGVRAALVMSYAFQIAFYFLLSFSSSYVADINRIIFLTLIALLSAVPAVIYWSAHHLYFIETTERFEEGRKLGFLTSIPVLFSVLSPFIGSYIITNFGYDKLFMVSGLLIIIGTTALFRTKEIAIGKSRLDVVKIINKKCMKRNTIFITQGISTASTSFLWPIALYLLSISIMSIGGLYLVANAVHCIFIYLSGKRIDLGKGKALGRIGAIGQGLSIILRSISETITSLTAFTSMGGAFGGILNLTLDSNFFRKSHDNAVNAVMNREFYMHIGRITLVLLVLLLSLFVDIKSTIIISLFLSGVVVFSSAGLIDEEIV